MPMIFDCDRIISTFPALAMLMLVVTVCSCSVPSGTEVRCSLFIKKHFWNLSYLAIGTWWHSKCLEFMIWFICSTQLFTVPLQDPRGSVFAVGPVVIHTSSNTVNLNISLRITCVFSVSPLQRQCLKQDSCCCQGMLRLQNELLNMCMCSLELAWSWKLGFSKSSLLA